ncbi:HDOD domain-containing protein [Maribrevibacterium harenarium]|uniref:HDOD domain-containing protein n=1 Tax=Maribrevibacterium harenarium TaxID=2589817 RepID=A0A501WLT9_9GAMM|nr:HDOD domain-containing protein [Maribrevibacterium harenarium]TPE49345.1 HDOD domain-containing protein [Maribrevibacterium harenarium]
MLVAEKVENQAMFDLCLELGFEYFQGYFLKKPEVIKGKRVDANVQSAMNLVSALQDEQINIDTIANLVSQHPKLSYQLLRILNSPVAGIPRKVESIREAVVYLGLTQLRKWALLITATSSSNKNIDQLKLLLVRARCCQLLADNSKNISSDVAFTMGLMSGIDLLLGIDRQTALKQIALQEGITKAILLGEGPLGKLLYCTMCIEQERWDAIEKMPSPIRKALNHAFFDALRWANDIAQELRQ